MPPNAISVLTADAVQLQNLLQSGQVDSMALIEAYLDQINKHDDYLHAMIQLAPLPLLQRRAMKLDKERKEGRVRGPLHGIPIMIKDNIATHPDLGLQTTAGSLALLSSRRGNARVVDLLIEAGAIILGKSNLTELSNFKGESLTSGWSAVGGQVQSAYVRKGLDPHDSHVGHSTPSGSSSGSAVGVSAGYSPLAIGTETDGSLTSPSGRAALYTIKPTIGIVPQAGIVPVSHRLDSAGPMTKTVHDLAVLLDVISERGNSSSNDESFTSNLQDSWGNISVATLDPEIWSHPNIKPVQEATEQINREIRGAYQKIKSLAKNYVENVPLITKEKIALHGNDSLGLVMLADFKRDMNTYLRDLDVSDVRSIKELIEFNNQHKEKELPLGNDNQRRLIAADEQKLRDGEYGAHVWHMCQLSRESVRTILEANNVDVIIGPTDSKLSGIAACAGYPIAQAPLSYLDYNGRPFGVSILAKGGDDALLVRVLSAWEATFPARKPPPSLEKSSVVIQIPK
ncbi:amidase signature enzyme [Corynespora cassiicola Philippines]|uniref:Amidase signature enzyme n=1 Tax=Corynespora cassiicola Philippines TaxID=1448308 RepID=A0A2T2NEN6_CORCC|nr:amidase signature enzyme [Corynespora cassiicola Philippines]